MKADTATRPATLADYVGQPEMIATLRRAIAAARQGDRQLGHLLVTGGPGLGKTSIARAIAAEIGAPIVEVTAPAIEHKGALAALLTGLPAGAVLFIDEIHALDSKIQELLYPAMEDGVCDLVAGKKVIRMQLAPFTLVAATTRPAQLAQPLRDRFAYSFTLRPYDLTAIATIVRRAAIELGLALELGAADEIARRSRGTPRIALRLLRATRDFSAAARAGSRVSAACAAAALDACGIDGIGLTALDREYLRVVVDAGAPIGLDAICAQIAEERRTIEEVVEPFLLSIGYVRRTKAGRAATAAGVGAASAPVWRSPRDRRLPAGDGGELDVEDAEVLS